MSIDEFLRTETLADMRVDPTDPRILHVVICEGGENYIVLKLTRVQAVP